VLLGAAAGSIPAWIFVIAMILGMIAKELSVRYRPA